MAGGCRATVADRRVDRIYPSWSSNYFASSQFITNAPTEGVFVATIPGNGLFDPTTLDLNALRGPVSNAADATSRAIEIATRAARASFPRIRFHEGGAPAVFNGQKWVWRGRVGYGLGDVEAEIRLNPDGTVAETNITSMGSAAPVTPIVPLR